MKRNLLFLILVISLPAFSQNWAPINTTEKFCYSSDDTLEIINNVLWVDSVKSFNNQEVYYMNKIVKLFNHEGYENHYMYDEPQFLADSIIISEDGSWEFVDAFPIPDDGGFELYPFEDVGFQWNFLSEITAEIESKDTLSIFGELDSIKTIQLSNNQQIVLSKEHGIINWRDEFTLVGIEGRDLGINVFMFEDMFKNVDAGDVICISKYEALQDISFYSWSYYERFNILGIERYPDSIIISGDIFSYSVHYYSDTTINTWGNDYVIRKYFKNDSTDVYPNLTISPYWDEYNPDAYKAITKISSHRLGGQKKTQVICEDEGMLSSIFEECEDLYPRILCPVFFDLNIIEYSENFGIPEYEIGFFEHFYDQRLEGVIDNGDTLGIIYPIDMFVGTNQLTSKSDWLVYPNPAKDQVFLHSSQIGNVTIQLFKYSGILIRDESFQKYEEEISISISDVSSGVYLIKIIQDDQAEVLRFVKQ